MPAVFALPDHLAAKSDPALVAADEAHFAAVAATLEQSVADLGARLDVVRRDVDRDTGPVDSDPGGAGQAALDRDLEVHRLGARLRTLQRYRLDLCLGRIVHEDGTTLHVGRLGLLDRDGEPLLVDWRSPAAEPFFAATHAHPMGLASRRRYRWTRGRITDYWDEAFTEAGLAASAAALDDQSAFVASLGSSRSRQMRDVLSTIQADQDAIIRAGSRGTLVVDGGPGTGKTVVALHRAAYLLYADPRIDERRGGILFVGPHAPYLAYVADVLPSLGEDGVVTCTLRDLVPEGHDAPDEADPAVAALKARAEMVAAIEPAVRLYEEPPREGMDLDTPWGEVWLSPADWAEAFEAVAGTPHDEARDAIRDELVAILLDKLPPDADADPEVLRRHPGLSAALVDAWPLLEPTDVVGDLWDVPAYLRMAAPWLTPDEVRLLRRADPHAWTTSDLPLLDAARRRVGDPEAESRARRRRAVLAEQREQMDAVVEHLLAADDGGGLVQSLRQADLREALVDTSAAPEADPDRLAQTFAHVVVDEAQELTDAEWQMLLPRCPSRSFTVVGDRAQASHGFEGTWAEHLARAGLDQVRVETLSVNYRTPTEVMSEAEPVILAALPDANVPTSVRSSGLPVVRAAASSRDHLLATWAAEHPDGVACVIGDDTFTATDRVASLTPATAKGLEFDLVVLVDPERWGAVDQYVAMTRATQELVVLSS